MKKLIKNTLLAFAAIFVFACFIVVVGALVKLDERRRQAPGPPVVVPDTPAAELAPPTPPQEPQGPVDSWEREHRRDDFDGSRITVWCLESSNVVNMDFPYRGEQRLQLCIRQRGFDDVELYMGLPRGQILCGLRGCDVSVLHGAVDASLGSLTLTEVPFVRASGGMSSVIFADEPRELIRLIQDSGRIRVRLEFYRQGAFTFDFQTHMDEQWY